MFFASDNSSALPQQIMTALVRANEGFAMPYGNDAIMARLRDQIRDLFDAPNAAVYLVSTGTAANALALATYCDPWSTVFCHRHAHIAEDECGAPEFYTHGAKLSLVGGTGGKMTPDSLHTALQSAGGSVHNMQRGMVSITNVTEAGTVYSAAEIAALAAEAHAFDLPCHLDGARFANALVATGATPAEMTWQAGIDVLSFGGTKNGLMGVEAVVLFDAKKAWEFELRRKRAGHLPSKLRYMAAQMEAYLAEHLWLDLAAQANSMAARLAAGLLRIDGVSLRDGVEANILFPHWPLGGHARLSAKGAIYYDMPAPDGLEGARLVTSWSTSEAHVDEFLSALHG